MQSAVDQGNFVKILSPALHEGLRGQINAVIAKDSALGTPTLELLILAVANEYKSAMIEQYEALKSGFEQEFKSDFYPLSVHETLIGRITGNVLDEYSHYLPGYNEPNL